MMKNFGSNGRLGNQIFQYLFLWSLAKIYNNYFYLPITPSFNDIFDIKYLSYSNIELFNTASKDIINIHEKSDYLVQNFSIDIMNNYDFNGYFQNISYFWKNIKYIISNELVFKNKILLENIEKLKTINRIDDLCAVHIRLTDYIKFSDTFIQLDSDYYKKSMQLVLSDKPNTKFLIYSDDIKLCQTKYKDISNIKFMTNNSDIDDFYQISLCGSKIISNSTFSLTACLLDKNIQKSTVIYPKKWLHKTNLNPIGETKIKNWLAV